TKYQSTLNEIEKGKQKPEEGGGKTHLNWVGDPEHVTGGVEWRRCTWLLTVTIIPSSWLATLLY
ncbi:hypothetical protein JYU34_003524, partial [Plutella xylostella]